MNITIFDKVSGFSKELISKLVDLNPEVTETIQSGIDESLPYVNNIIILTKGSNKIILSNVQDESIVRSNLLVLDLITTENQTRIKIYN